MLLFVLPPTSVTADEVNEDLLIPFNVPEQRVDLALTQFAEQAGITLLFPSDAIGDVMANRLVGEYSVSEGAEILLAGTKLIPTFKNMLVLNIALDPDSSNGETVVKKPKSILAGAVLAGALASSNASAEEQSGTNAHNKGFIEEIVVTANKREQGLMEVAQSVQYFRGSELEAAGVQNLDEIVRLIPGVSLPATTASTTAYNIRGTGAVIINDSAVGFYVDGMPHYIVDEPYGPDIEVYDMESIQVLRGPQGTLYGQGAVGGTILITTAKPDLEQVRARVRAGYSRMHEGGNGHTFDTSISVPLIENVLAASLTAGTSRDPGLAEGIDFPGSDLDEDDRWYARLKVLWEPTDELSITGVIHHRDLEEGFPRISYSSADPPLLGAVGGIETGIEAELTMYGLNIDWDAGFATLTSSSSYMAHERASGGGFAFSDPSFGDFLFDFAIDHEDVKTFNQELRLVSNGEGDWDWITGVSYSKGEHPVKTVTDTLMPLAFAGIQTDEVVTESSQVAVFGEISRSFKDGLITPLIGLRYFRDDRDKQVDSTIESFGFVLPLTDADQQEVFSLVSPRFNLRITPSDATTFFLNISRGFRSGTFNTPGDVAFVGELGIALDPAVPESAVWSYEVGGRFNLFDNTLLIEPTVYLADYEDYQFAATLASRSVRIAIEEVRATGAELLVQWNTPLEGLSVSMIGSVNSTEVEEIDATTDEFLFGIEDGEQLPYVPEWDVRLGVDYEWQAMGDWTAYASASYFRRDGQIDFNSPQTSPVVSDFSLRLALENQNWRATLWGRNLADDEGPASVAGGGNVVRWDRRSVGMTVEYTLD